MCGNHHRHLQQQQQPTPTATPSLGSTHAACTDK